jgi:hypothetical protein
VTYVSGCGIGGCEVVPIDHARLAGIGG